MSLGLSVAIATFFAVGGALSMALKKPGNVAPRFAILWPLLVASFLFFESQLYGQLHTSIEGVAWVVTAYNAAVAVVALGLVLFVHRLRATSVLVTGLLVFMAASIACSLSGSLGFLIAARTVQGVGAALLLAGIVGHELASLKFEVHGQPSPP